MVSKLKFTLYESEKGPRSILSDLATGDKLLVGRGQNVQLWINDKNISREHCQIECEDGNVYVSDLKSRNDSVFYKKQGLKTEMKYAWQAQAIS
ncbi:MAG: FHA domain-containing protein [Candidatus Brocadiae bacterium]|nr:FHA domain-containing protein [Candidatus Brocadiia bacterium]